MQNHLYVRQNVCNASISSLELTEEIKAIIMRDRIYRPPRPPPTPKQPSIVNNYKQINYIINQFDPVSKVEKITTHKQTPLIDLSQHTEDVFMSRIRKLNNNEVSNYQLTMENLVAFVDELTNVTTVDRMNIMYDKRTVCKIFNNGCWNRNDLDEVPHAIVQSIKDVFLDVYECYLLRKIYAPEGNAAARTQFNERLKEYYRFIFAFGMKPGVKGCSNADILNNLEDDDYTIADEMMELFTKSTDEMKGSDIRKITKQTKTIILRNCKEIIHDLDDQIKQCMSKDPDFRELMMNGLACNGGK